MKYALEHVDEFSRLEKQSLQEAYDFRNELNEFSVNRGSDILDAGCGSGIVTRYLAERFPGTFVSGCDFSELRIKQAQKEASQLTNVSFSHQDLTRLGFRSESFDAVVCRYVMEHLSPVQQQSAIDELKRCLKPGGQIWIIDVDGFFYNVYPQTESLVVLLAKLEINTSFDFKIGRKLPTLLNGCGLEQIEWRIDPMQFQGKSLDAEIQMLEQRFSQANDVLVSIFGSQDAKDLFVRDYLECLRKPNAVLFYSKFVVKAVKPKLRVVQD